MAQALARGSDAERERVLATYPKVMKDELGGYFTLGRWFAHAIGHPEVMRLATRYGLPRTTLMRFLLKLMANLPDPRWAHRERPHHQRHGDGGAGRMRSATTGWVHAHAIPLG